MLYDDAFSTTATQSLGYRSRLLFLSNSRRTGSRSRNSAMRESFPPIASTYSRSVERRRLEPFPGSETDPGDTQSFRLCQFTGSSQLPPGHLLCDQLSRPCLNLLAPPRIQVIQFIFERSHRGLPFFSFGLMRARWSEKRPQEIGPTLEAAESNCR
jgi:hypothetical protein